VLLNGLGESMDLPETITDKGPFKIERPTNQPETIAPNLSAAFMRIVTGPRKERRHQVMTDRDPGQWSPMAPSSLSLTSEAFCQGGRS
jgi:hypothetical protein